MRRSLLVFACSLGAASAGLAADGAAPKADDQDALSLADEATPSAAAGAKPWRLFVEGAAGQGRLRSDDDTFRILRGPIDFRWDDRILPTLRAVFSDRLDGVDSDGVPPGDNVNTVREAFLSWSWTEQRLVDLGRVNIRNGAAFGYNPTDWFKANAVRAFVDPDPAFLRENRQGTVVVQVQQLWDEGSLSAAFSPRLARTPDSATFALNVGATNPENRYIVAGSYKLHERVTPQLLVYGGADISPQVGLNVSGLIGDSVVAFGEVAVGRGPMLVAQATDQPQQPQSSQQRAAVGLTYTTPFNLSLTAEAEYNSAAPFGNQWSQIPALAQQQVLATSQNLQDLPTRSQWFFYTSWQDLLVKRLKLTGFWRQDMQTNSRATWLEARYAWDSVDLALQWQAFGGSAGTVYYAAPEKQTLQLVLRLYI
jgi:hypothetical protein